ncbi:MAG TPA: methylthioribulose 1-phosphate dehydratase [Pilimelia sp.]|nr:methylthioribulose 1-phosphate dehydratase [Pilimelia sp.]
MTAADVSLEAMGATLAAEAARFASFGWMRGTSGNLSVVLSRDPLELLVTASGLDKGLLTPTDVVVVDADGRTVAAHSRTLSGRPSVEAAVHARIAKVTGANAIVHLHTVASVVAARRWPAGIELAELEMLKGIGIAASGEKVLLPVVDNTQDMLVLCDRLEAARHPKIPAVVVADHGLFAWGSHPMQARHHTEIVEYLLEVAVALP